MPTPNRICKHDGTAYFDPGGDVNDPKRYCPTCGGKAWFAGPALTDSSTDDTEDRPAIVTADAITGIEVTLAPGFIKKPGFIGTPHIAIFIGDKDDTPAIVIPATALAKVLAVGDAELW